MNSTILQHNAFNLNYPVGNKYEYQSSDRQYNGTLPDGDFLPRKGGIIGSSFDQSMSLSNPSTGLNYSAGQLQHEACNTTNSQLILTPPQSGDEASSTITNPSSSSYSYSNITKATGSNASGPEYYSTTAPSFLPSFNGASMTSIGQRPLHITGPTPLSPPYTSYGSTSGGSSSFPPQYMRGMESYYPQHRVFQDPFRRTVPPPIGPIYNPQPYYQQQMPAASSRPEGPGFDDTTKINTLVNSRGHNISVDVLASIPKGFFRVEEKWTCYRRNYFNVSCGFSIKTNSHDNLIYLQRYNSQLEAVNGYAVSIAAKTAAANNAESESRGLVQHTPKRDKATETIPTRHVVLPSSPSSVSGNHPLSHGSLYASTSQIPCMQNGLDSFGHVGASTPQTTYTFERIQFQKATANNGKRRAQQQYFHVVVKLEVNVGRQGGPEDWVLVAQKQSQPMVVRGRSPGHYKDNRRDSQTSMDPDGGSGHSADGHNGYHIHSVNGAAHSSSMGNSHASYRHGHTYGTSFSHSAHHMDESENSTTSPGSSSTLASSPNKGETCHLTCSMTRASLLDTTFDRVILSPILNKISSDAIDYTHTRNKSYEDENRDCQGTFFHHPLDQTYHNPSFDFSATSTSQALCASS